ncbi:MAG TPA: transketolase C-terminal domain-containing protein, partial [Roseiflexaceae bacterium]|nr:transketolase C-terminal domain-containing protein [Roseiflexaceae bacterium]
LVPIGKARVRRAGNDVTITAHSRMVGHALKAAEDLAGQGIEAEVIDLRTLRPLDTRTILASVRKTGKVLIVHEDNLTGGLGGEISAIIGQQAFEYLDGPLVRIGGPDVPAMPYAHELEDAFLPSATSIAEEMRRLAAY